MRKVSKAEIDFVQKGLNRGIRLDGRLHNQMRNFKINENEDILKTANGACHLTLGQDLSILVGIKAGEYTIHKIII
jgi:exosome complex RNA-binding protein Rrp42 (RNase PH superfamily)